MKGTSLLFPLVTFFLLTFGSAVSAQTPAVAESSSLAPAAVVQLPSHGISATVIRTETDRSWLLTCAHGHRGSDRTKPIHVAAPAPTAAAPRPVSIRLVAIDYREDLALIEMSVGPLPYAAPVAPKGHRPGATMLSVGYDDMKWPATQRPAHTHTAMTQTLERPWHGRSGGALIDDSGFLVGVCSGYTGPLARDARGNSPGSKSQFQETHPAGRGLYVSHATIVGFLERNGWNFGGSQPSAPTAPPVQAPVPYAQPPVYRQPAAPYCPDGTCPPYRK